jgi:photosystem II stability/assembly factor-like uncharacterized protein
LLASEDRAATWHPVGDAFADAEIVSLALSPGFATDRTIFVATRERASTELVLWRSVDGGARWQRWLVERGQDVLPLALSPRFLEDRTVMAATNIGVFVSRDAGDSYAPWLDGLDPPNVIALAMSSHAQAYALGMGGATWSRRLA